MYNDTGVIVVLKREKEILLRFHSERAVFSNRLHLIFDQQYDMSTIVSLCNKGYLYNDGEVVRLTKRGYDVADATFNELENRVQDAAVSKRIEKKRKRKNALIIAVKFAVGVFTTLALPVLFFAAEKAISVHDALVMLWELVVEFVKGLW